MITKDCSTELSENHKTVIHEDFLVATDALMRILSNKEKTLSRLMKVSCGCFFMLLMAEIGITDKDRPANLRKFLRTIGGGKKIGKFMWLLESNFTYFFGKR